MYKRGAFLENLTADCKKKSISRGDSTENYDHELTRTTIRHV